MKRILVAEDDPDTREMLAVFLRRLGWTVTVAVDGLEALYFYHDALRRDDPYDVLLLDKRMPRLNGIGVGINVRNLEFLGATHRVYIYYVSADAKFLDGLTEVGFADDFITKPYELDQLLRMVGCPDDFNPQEQARSDRLMAPLHLSAEGKLIEE